MQKRKLITILEIIKKNKEEYNKLKLDLNNIFELDDSELSEILDCDKESDRFFKIVTYLDKSLLNEKQKSYFLNIINKRQKDLSIDDFLEIYNSVKNNKTLFNNSSESFSKYLYTLDYILSTYKEDYQFKYSIRTLSNQNAFYNENIQNIINSIVYASEEYKAECLYRITNYPNIMKNNFLLNILEMIKNSEIKEQAENVIMLGNSPIFGKNENSLEIMKLISSAKGKYQAMYGQLAATNTIILKAPNSLYLISLITTAKEDYQSEFIYKALCADLIYRSNNTKFAELIFNSKSRTHAMSLYKINNNFKILNKENLYEMLKIIGNSEFSTQTLYTSEAIKLSQQLSITDKTLEKIIKIICNTRTKESPKYIYNALKEYKNLKREDLMNVLRILSNSETEEDVKQVYIIFEEALERSTKETFNQNFRNQIKKAICEYEEKKLEELMNNDIDEVISILKKSESYELVKDSVVKVKKINIANKKKRIQI